MFISNNHIFGNHTILIKTFLEIKTNVLNNSVYSKFYSVLFCPIVKTVMRNHFQAQMLNQIPGVNKKTVLMCSHRVM